MSETQIDIVEGWDELSPDDQLAALKGTVTVTDVALLIGLEPDSHDKIRSPWNPEERTASCHLYDDHFFDYSTGKGGDIFDLVMALNPGTTLPQAVRAIRSRAVRAGKQYGDVETVVPREIMDFSKELGKLAKLDVYLGLDVREFELRQDADGNVIVPHQSPEIGTYAVKVRWKGGGKSAWAGSQPSYRLYDPLRWLRPVATTDVVLAEGESDAWALTLATGFEIDVLALPTGVGAWRDHWLEDLKPYSRVYICTDNDKAGHAGREKLTRKIGWGRAEQLHVPPLFNDAREAIASGWHPFD